MLILQAYVSLFYAAQIDICRNATGENDKHEKRWYGRYQQKAVYLRIRTTAPHSRHGVQKYSECLFVDIYHDVVLIQSIVPAVCKINDKLEKDRRPYHRQYDPVESQKLITAIYPGSLYDLMKPESMHIHPHKEYAGWDGYTGYYNR